MRKVTMCLLLLTAGMCFSGCKVLARLVSKGGDDAVIAATKADEVRGIIQGEEQVVPKLGAAAEGFRNAPVEAIHPGLVPIELKQFPPELRQQIEQHVNEWAHSDGGGWARAQGRDILSSIYCEALTSLDLWTRPPTMADAQDFALSELTVRSLRGFGISEVSILRQKYRVLWNLYQTQQVTDPEILQEVAGDACGLAASTLPR